MSNNTLSNPNIRNRLNVKNKLGGTLAAMALAATVVGAAEFTLNVIDQPYGKVKARVQRVVPQPHLSRDTIALGNAIVQINAAENSAPQPMLVVPPGSTLPNPNPSTEGNAPENTPSPSAQNTSPGQ